LTYAVGDIHGCLDVLRRLVQSLEARSSDVFVFIGDYVDRGPDSKGVIDYLIALSERYECHFIRGNHEQMFLDYLGREPGAIIWAYNGMERTMMSYGSLSAVPDRHIDFLNRTVYSYTIKRFVFVHAGVRPGITLEEQEERDLLWIREPFLSSRNPIKGKTIIYGHTPQSGGPLIEKSKIGIDTGCVYGGYLTAYRIEDKHWVCEK